MFGKRGPWTPPLTKRLSQIEESKFVEAQVNKGMVTMIDPADIPPGALQLAKNVYIRFDSTARRPGTTTYGPAKPDAGAVLRMATLKSNSGFAHTIRMTPGSVYELDSGAWVEITDANAVGEELAGTISDRFQTAVVLGDLVFSNFGVNEIQKIDFTANTFAKLGNAPKYRFITGFSNRVVGAAIRDDNEVQVGWSGNSNIEVWDSLTDETAGNTPLVDSPADLSDFITGLFGYTNIMVVLRERSVWVATKQPIPTQPFYFQSVIPGTGCDSPHSIANIGQGLAWLDRRSGAVYIFTPDGQFESIGQPIERTLLDNVEDPNLVFASYNPRPQEYTIFIPQVGSKYVNAWTYNLRGKTWARNVFYDLRSADDVDVGGSDFISIDALGDVPIDELTGTIDELSPPGEQLTTVRLYGYGDGTLAEEDINKDQDAPHDDFPNGVTYESDIISKVFTIPEDDIYITEVRIEYVATRGGQFTLEYSLDGGATVESWKLARTLTITQLEKPSLLRYKRVLRTRKYAWRLRSTRGLFSIINFEVYVSKAGRSTGRV